MKKLITLLLLFYSIISFSQTRIIRGDLDIINDSDTLHIEKQSNDTWELSSNTAIKLSGVDSINNLPVSIITKDTTSIDSIYSEGTNTGGVVYIDLLTKRLTENSTFRFTETTATAGAFFSGNQNATSITNYFGYDGRFKPSQLYVNNGLLGYGMQSTKTNSWNAILGQNTSTGGAIRGIAVSGSALAGNATTGKALDIYVSDASGTIISAKYIPSGTENKFMLYPDSARFSVPVWFDYDINVEGKVYADTFSTSESQFVFNSTILRTNGNNGLQSTGATFRPLLNGGVGYFETTPAYMGMIGGAGGGIDYGASSATNAPIRFNVANNSGLGGAGVNPSLINSSTTILTGYIDSTVIYNDLIVKGFITADSAVFVNNNYSDIVFDNDYQLETLEDQIKYAYKNGHLKGMDRSGYVNPVAYINDLELKLEELYLYSYKIESQLLTVKKIIVFVSLAILIIFILLFLKKR